jgi:hypothetical protein
MLNSPAFEQARTLPKACQSASSETPAMEHGLDADACKARCLSPTHIVYCPIIRGQRPGLAVRMAAARDLPKLYSSCTTVPP